MLLASESRDNRLARYYRKIMSPVLCVTEALRTVVTGKVPGKHAACIQQAAPQTGDHGPAPPAAARRTHRSVTPASPLPGAPTRVAMGYAHHRELSEPSYQGLSRAHANSMYERILDTARINVYKHTRCGAIFALALPA
jgi:hypothetical protein